MKKLKVQLAGTDLKINNKLLLGFPNKISELKNEGFIRLREIIFLQLGLYIKKTERFTKPTWIIPFLKAGIG